MEMNMKVETEQCHNHKCSDM